MNLKDKIMDTSWLLSSWLQEEQLVHVRFKDRKKIVEELNKKLYEIGEIIDEQEDSRIELESNKGENNEEYQED